MHSQFTASFVDRLYARGRDDGNCRLWTGSVGSHGYGQVRLNQQTLTVHTVAWKIASGADVPVGMFVLHTCDVKRCYRNDEPGIYVIRKITRPRFGHLWLGTNADNVADMIDKGRAGHIMKPATVLRGDRHWMRRAPERIARGEHQGSAKLTNLEVAAIRAEYERGSKTHGSEALGRRYGVNAGTILNIISGRYWRHVP